MARVLLELCFLFFVGSCLGWCIEVLFRRFFSAKKWINPGFLNGPYLPMYGFGTCILFGFSSIPLPKWAIVVIVFFALTLLEYLTGLIFIKGFKLKDTQCGFKAIKGDIAREMSLKTIIDRFAFDVEYLYYAKLNNYSILEFPVTWINDLSSTVKIASSSMDFLKDMSRIKSNKKEYLERENDEK